MYRQRGLPISDSLRQSLGYAERLLQGVTPDVFARFARPGGHMVESNHPAFIYGHLSLYAPRILQDLGEPAPATPEGFEQVFSKDATCVDDPEGTIYPAMEQVVDFFQSGYEQALQALIAATDETFLQPNPLGGVMAEKFPTLGSMHNFYVGGHIMIHMGQMSAWRRMQGLGRA